MRKHLWFFAAVAGLSLAVIVSAQEGAAKFPAYNVKSEVVVKGKVASVSAIPDWMGKDGVNVMLETPDSVVVHVDTAPAEFFKMVDFALANGDNLEVVGSWATWNGNRVLLAKSLTRQKVMIAIRDPEGKPIW